MSAWHCSTPSPSSLLSLPNFISQPDIPAMNNLFYCIKKLRIMNAGKIWEIFFWGNRGPKKIKYIFPAPNLIINNNPMADFSFDVVCQFDMMELKNAVDQVKREILTRYDFKGTNAEITLTDAEINILVPDTMKLQALKDMLVQKVINRKLSPKILEFKEHEPAAGGAIKQTVKLVKVLDSETCKQITKIIKDNFPKCKGSIQGETVRVSSKSKDDLQAVIAKLNATEFKQPLLYQNYR